MNDILQRLQSNFCSPTTKEAAGRIKDLESDNVMWRKMVDELRRQLKAAEDRAETTGNCARESERKSNR